MLRSTLLASAAVAVRDSSRREGLVSVTLLGETSATTEARIQRLAVDEELALDLADSLALRDRVEEGSLSGT